MLDAVRRELENDTYRFYLGTSYRHCLIWAKGSVVELTPPHDVLGQVIGDYLPQDAILRQMQERSYEILSRHPLNLERKRQGKNPANSIWFWGAGTRPALSSFYEKYHKRGVMISAGDLLKGIAVGAGMDNISVEGANGGLHTNYEGKARAAVKALSLDGYDFAYIHVEAPDEMGHQGSVERKIQGHRESGSAGDSSGEGRTGRSQCPPIGCWCCPDHPTPIRVRTHTADPVPYLLYDSSRKEEHSYHYNEKEAALTDHKLAEGWMMMERLFAE